MMALKPSRLGNRTSAELTTSSSKRATLNESSIESDDDLHFSRMPQCDHETYELVMTNITTPRDGVGRHSVLLVLPSHIGKRTYQDFRRFGG